MKTQAIADAIFATVLGAIGCAALVHWALTCNVVGA